MSLLIFFIYFISIFYFTFLFLILIGVIKAKRKSKASAIEYNVSIIIPFRNEAGNIEKSVLSLMAQNYDKNKYEVIYINDNSNDESVSVLKKYLNSNVKLINNDGNHTSGFKKYAIEKAINESFGDIIFLTDADCVHDKNWIKSMLGIFGEKTGMVAGPVIFSHGKSMFSKLQQLEFAGLMLSSAGLIKINKPTICSSANLAFRKKIFFEVDGYLDNINLTSGDDELLMQKINLQTNYKIDFCWSENALIKTSGNQNISDFFQQRRRWASKSLFYRNKILVLSLFVIFLFYLSLLIMPLMLAANIDVFLLPLLFSISGKLLIEFIIIWLGKNLFFEKKILKYFLVAELFQIPYIPIVAVLGSFGNYKWKGRNIKR